MYPWAVSGYDDNNLVSIKNTCGNPTLPKLTGEI